MAWQHLLKARWAALGSREQRGVALAATALLAALAWGVLLAPALRTLKAVPAQNAALDAQLERMHAMQARAQMLQAKPAVVAQETLKALQAATALLGKGAALQVVGDHATVTLKQISAAGLAPWFAPVSAAGLSPTDVHLQRSSDAAESLWSGVLVFSLPAGANATP